MKGVARPCDAALLSDSGRVSIVRQRLTDFFEMVAKQ